MHKITVPQRKNHRIGVFVDVSNMYHSAKNLYKSRVNFRELLKLATANRQLVRAIAYVIKSDTKEEKAFFDALEKAGYDVGSCPVAEKVSEHCVNLPTHHNIHQKETLKVIDFINSF